MRLVLPCKYCKKPKVLLSETPIGETQVWATYKCGHSEITERATAHVADLHLESTDGSKRAREYQKAGVEFILGKNGSNGPFNCIIGDQMRLGKTPQSLLALANAYEERTPCLILVRSANLWQWIREYKVWCDALPTGIFPIIGTKNWIPPGFSAYIVSMDTFSRDGMTKKLLDFGFKLVIIDEAHSFKNTESKRSQALTGFLHEISIETVTNEIPFVCGMCGHQWKETMTVTTSANSGRKRTAKTAYCPICRAYNTHTAHWESIDRKERKCGLVMLTGTAIKNRADEYFVPLNLLAPEKFPSLANFQQRWLVRDGLGKFSRVNPYLIEDFKKMIAPYVLRREKEDVYDSLPPINRMFTVIEIEDGRLKKAYNDALTRLERKMNDNPNLTFFDSIGELMLLRQICGMAKVKWASEYADSLLTDEPESRLAIGIHHHSVRDALAFELDKFGVLKLSGEDSAEAKDLVMRKFEHSKERLLVINMLAGGVGMDFHYCDNVLILERQWSSADEEQFEFRFYNPDKSIKDRTTNLEYVLAKGTIDEWFYDLVESKRQIFGETISNNWSLQNDPATFRGLVEQTVSNRL